MRIIGGEFKGRILRVPSHIRPASFRLRKSVFDLLRDEIKDKVILDLFGGSGALGIEALSLGAKEAVFVDINKACVNVIIKNISVVRSASSCRIFLKDSSRAVKSFSHKNTLFDIVFIDPPYYKGMVKKILKVLDEYDILAPSGYLVILCYRSDEFSNIYSRGSLIYDRIYGQSRVLIYAKS